MGRIKTYTQFLNEAKITSAFFTTYEETKKWLDKMGVENYTINEDLTVDVDVNVDLRHKKLEKIPVKFGKVGGSFSCRNNQLTSLEGCPEKIVGDFGCSYNQLTSLEGIPKSVGGDFLCYENKLTSLVFAPKEPSSYGSNPCTKIYDRLGFTTEAHIEALETLDPNPEDTIQLLKLVNPGLARELSFELGLEEDEELTNVYNKVKSIEGGYF